MSEKKTNKELRKLTRASAKALDKNILMLDYQNNYDLDGVLKNGVATIADLIKHIVKLSGKKESDFTIGTAKGGGCSTFDAFTPDGDHIMGRNFDFKVAPCLVLWTHPEGYYKSISIVDHNFLTYGNKRNIYNDKKTAQLLLAPYCCVDGINEKGLSIAVLQIRAKATKQADPSKTDITTTSMVRAVLDTCADVDEAVEFIASRNMHDSLYCCYHYQISDKSGRSVMVEYIDNELHVYEKNSEKYSIDGSVYDNDGLERIYVTNHTITKNVGSFKVEQHGEDRTNAIRRALKAKNGIFTEKEAMDLLNYLKLDYDHPKYPWRIEALWSSVYNSNKCTLAIAAGRDYRNIYTFAVDKPYEVIGKDGIEESEYPSGNWDYL